MKITYREKQAVCGIKLDNNLEEILQCTNMLAPYSNGAMSYIDDILNPILWGDK